MIEHTYEFIKSMNSEFKFYTYCHIRKDTNAVFYVGKGCGKRAWDKRRNTHWQRIVNKAGYYVQIISFHATEELALSFESSIIIKFRNSLSNKTDGGDGCSGLIMSDEAKEKCRIGKLGDKNPNYGLTGSDNPSFKGDIIATNIETGEQIILRGPDEMINNGFKPASIYRVLPPFKYKRHSHKGYTFIRI